MQLRFWGTRGSIASPGPGTVRYGGNTSCVEVRSSAGTLVILDCGTGAHALGHALLASGSRLRGHILITHTHWDHIQGIPFFLPLFAAGNEWDVYAPRGLNQSLRDTLAGQMQYTYFPVTLEQLGATIRYHDLVEGGFDLGDIRVRTQYLNHTALALGYRLEADGVSLVYATDHEPHSRHLAETLTGTIAGEDERHADFLASADLVVHDAQYTAREYAVKTGWGHSTLEYVVHLASAGGVRRLALFHHDPLRDDDAVDGLVTAARRLVAASGASLDVFAAAEGQVVDLGRAHPVTPRGPATPLSTVAEEPAALRGQSVLVAVSDPELAAALTEAVQSDPIRVLLASDGDSVIRLVRAERPSLVLVDRHLPVADAFAVCRAVRSDATAYARDVPIVIVAAPAHEEDVAAWREAGGTDWLLRPFSTNYARTRIRAWLLRSVCRWGIAPRPEDEEARLLALRALNLLDTPAEERFDRLTRVAAMRFEVPIVLVSLVDRDRQWFKSSHGLEVRETSRDSAFCAHAILGPDVLLVPDALLDSRFADNPLVTGHPRVRFYAGQPLTIQGRHRVGTLCLIDHRPRQLDEAELRLLRELALLVQRELERRG